MRFPAISGLLLLLTLPGAATAQRITVTPELPVRGETATLTVTGEEDQPLAGKVVEITYRPNSETTSIETLSPTDPSGQVAWTPRDAGIVTLTVGDLVSHNVAVRFGRFPSAGLAIMILAGMLLFGGAGLGFVVLLRSGEAPEPAVGETPST